jgi:proline iminopeptidase
MKKIIFVIALTLLTLVLVGGGYVWYAMQQPLYKPGMVRAAENLRAPLTPPQQPADSSTWSVEPDIELAHFAAGEGRNVLIIHGGPGMPYASPWPGLEPLTGDYRFHYYDQRGSGRSTRPIDTFPTGNYYQNMLTLERMLGLGAQIADIERIRRLLRDDKLILIGHSWGGFLASLYAAEFPEHVESLILIAPADVLLMPQQHADLFDLVRQHLPVEMQADYGRFQQQYLDFGNIFTNSEADLVALGEEFGKYYRAAINTPLPEQGAPGGWMVFAMYFSIGQRHDYRVALRAVEAPVLVIHAADDLQPVDATRAYAAAFPNAQFEVIGNSGHFPFYEQPEAFFEIVGKWLK